MNTIQVSRSGHQAFGSDDHAPSFMQRPTPRQPIPQLLLAMLDEVDQGLILVEGNGSFLYANHVAREALAVGDVLCQKGDTLSALHPAREQQLRQAIARAAVGRRSLVLLSAPGDDQGDGCCLVCLPLASACMAPYSSAHSSASTVMLMLGRSHHSTAVTLTLYAKAHAITSAEEAVLRALCQGQELQDYALAHGVALSTVRSHVRALRAKTGTSSMRQMIQKIAALPPLVSTALRYAPQFGENAGIPLTHNLSRNNAYADRQLNLATSS